MPKIFLTHIPDMLKNYYGERALAALRELATCGSTTPARCSTPRRWRKPRAAARSSCPTGRRRARRSFSPARRDLVAFLRVAVDIRNIDVAAASAQGILVTHATPGFIASVAEMAIGFMIDCGRHITEAASVYHAGRVPQARMGRQLKGATARHHRLWRDRRISGPARSSRSA